MSALILKEFPYHSSKSDEDGMLLGDTHNKAQPFEVVDHLKCLFILLKDAGSLLYEKGHIEYFIMMII
jgi:hypothetical protein